jgi:6-phosphogluconolactonase (cycloisomerase 2 family)
LSIPSFDPSNSTQIPSDSIIVHAIDHATGKLSFVQRFAAGGRVPRHFSYNKAGNLVAVGLQGDSRVVIIERDVTTGLLKRYIASTTVPGEITTVIFNE